MDHHCSSQCGSSGSHHCRWYHHGPFLAATRPPSGLSKGSLGCHTAPGSNATRRDALRPHHSHHSCRFRIAYLQGRLSKADVAEGISSLISRHSTSSATDLTLLQLQIKTLELELSEPEPQSRTEIRGVFVYILAKISQFVLKTLTPQWARNVQERSGASLSASSADNRLADHLSRRRESEFLDVVRTGFWHSSVTEDPYVQRHPEAGSLRTYASLADSACIQANVTASDPAPDGVYVPAVALGQNFSNGRAPCAASSKQLTADSDLTEPPSLISCGTRTVLGSSTSGPRHSDSQLSVCVREARGRAVGWRGGSA